MPGKTGRFGILEQLRADGITYMFGNPGTVEQGFLDALLDVTNDLRRDEIALVVARLRTRMERQFEDAGVLDAIGRAHLYPTVHAAVDAYTSRDGGS